MLSLEQCKRLKECGVDQGTFTGEYTGTVMVYLLHHDCTGQAMSRESATQCRGCKFVALYNSDEMIAYIQQRWPDARWNVSFGTSGFTVDGFVVTANLDDENGHCAYELGDPNFGGNVDDPDDALDSALCKLICALADAH